MPSRSRLPALLPLATAVLAVAAQPTRTAAQDKDKKAADPQLTVAGLKTMLDGMGLDGVGELKRTDGTTYGYGVEVRQDGRTTRVSVYLSPNEKWLWVAYWLETPAKGAKVPADVYKKMLERNYEVGMPFFSVDSTNGQPRLATVLPNRGVTPQTLRRELDDLAAEARTADTLWDPAKWKDAKPDVPEKGPDPKPKGGAKP